MATEQEILKAIAEVELKQKDARNLITFHKKAAIDAESDLIEANLHRERLAEQLRRLRLSTVRHDLSKEDIELEEFRARLPELLKKI